MLILITNTSKCNHISVLLVQKTGPSTNTLVVEDLFDTEFNVTRAYKSNAWKNCCKATYQVTSKWFLPQFQMKANLIDLFGKPEWAYPYMPQIPNPFNQFYNSHMSNYGSYSNMAYCYYHGYNIKNFCNICNINYRNSFGFSNQGYNSIYIHNTHRR